MRLAKIIYGDGAPVSSTVVAVFNALSNAEFDHLRALGQVLTWASGKADGAAGPFRTGANETGTETAA
jgi:hypothetical protein